MSEREIKEGFKASKLKPGESDVVYRFPIDHTFDPIPTPEIWMNASTDILCWFKCDYLAQHQHATTKLFEDLARTLASTIAPGPERTIALRKLLEAKDAAVRATITPGG